MIKLKFGKGNGKMQKLAGYLGIPKSHILTFDVPAGYTCAKANICKSYANRYTGKVTMVGTVLCYAAKSERYLPSVRRGRWFNYMALLGLGNDVKAIAEAIIANIAKQTEIVRIHSSGEFYSKAYFEAWVMVAKALPQIQFFGYTKHLEYALADKPNNFVLQYSFGGLDDDLYKTMIAEGRVIPTCKIGEYENQYPEKVVCGKDGEHEDYFAILNRESFVIMAH